MAELKLIKLSEVKREEVKWLWYPYIPFVKLTLIEGDPGDGKTMLVLNLCALLSKGLPLPENEIGTEPITVIYQTAEDGLVDTIKPRFEDADGDNEKFITIDDTDNPLTLLDKRREKAINVVNAKLFILDPIQAYLGEETDMHRSNSVRPLFKQLGAVAQRTGCAIVFLGHCNKMQGAKGMYRGLGSIDIPAACRSVLVVGKPNEESEVRYMAQLKNSLAPFGDTLTFTIDKSIEFTGTSNVTAQKLLSGSFFGENMASTKKDFAIEKLTELLQNGEIPCSEAYDYLNELGISNRTVDNAKKALGVVSTKQGKVWHWSLPKRTTQQNS